MLPFPLISSRYWEDEHPVQANPDRESYCTVLIKGEFTNTLTNTTPHVSFNVTSHLPDGHTGLIPGEDSLCNWVDIIQDSDDDGDSSGKASAQVLLQYDAQYMYSDLPSDSPNPISRRHKRKDKRSCPPKEGKAQISSTILLLGGYVPEANFTVKVKATEEHKEGREGRTIFDLWTEFELKYKDGMFVE